MKELYDKVIEAFNSGDENLFVAATRNWAEAGGDNPFPSGTEEYTLFANACKAYNIWRSGAINSRVSKKRMVAYIQKIAEKGLPNPYVVHREFGVTTPNVPVETEGTKGWTEPKVKHVFGVIPKYEPVISDEPEPKRRKKKASK